ALRLRRLRHRVLPRARAGRRRPQRRHRGAPAPLLRLARTPVPCAPRRQRHPLVLVGDARGHPACAAPQVRALSVATPLAYRDRWVAVPDGHLHVVEWATRGPFVLLTHGVTAQAHVWDPIAQRLSATHHVLSLDQRGHGDSLKPATGYALDNYLADMLAVL